MKKSRIIALLTAAVMIMSVIPAMANVDRDTGAYFIDAEGGVYEKSGDNMIENPDFTEGLTGLTQNEEYYKIDEYGYATGDPYCLAAIKSTKGDGAITAYFPVEDANSSYYLSFAYQNIDDIPRRPRVTFAFTDSSKVIPTEEDDFTEATNAWIQAGTASNDQDMAYSKGDWVYYSTVLKGNGNQDACKYVALNIYGLKGNVSFLDSFELYELIPSEKYYDMMAAAIKEWKTFEMPKGSLEGFGTLEIPREVSVEGIGVEWSSTSEAVNAETGEYSAQPEEELVILKARLYAEEDRDANYEFEYPYIIKSMFTPYIEWMKSEVFAELGSAINDDLSLVKSHKINGYYPATITWECSDNAVLDENGNFTAPETTKDVDLVATIECNGATTSLTKRMKAIGGNIVNDGLIMYYDFEKTGKGVVYDNSQKANVYDAESDGVTYADGFARFAGGDSVINLPTNYAQELTGSYSVSMWVKPDKSIATNAGLFRFFDFGGGTTNSQFLAYIPSSGQLSFMDRGTSGSISKWAMNTTVSGLIDTWTLLSLVYDFSSSPAIADLYVNGQLVATSDTEYSDLLTKSVFAQVGGYSEQGYIGRTQWMNAENPDYVGLMDDVRIYNRAITADEITTLYNETRPTITAPVTIEFRLGDIDGEKLKDDVVVSADVDATYDVPSSYKSLPSSSDDQYRYVYKYVFSKSWDSITVSADRENVCIVVFELEKQPKGTNLIENGSFENGIAGWTNRQGTDITGATVEYDNSIGANVMKIATLGKSDTQNIGTVWNVEIGKDYTISFDIYTGKVLDANNYQYNRLTDGFALGDVGQRENSGNDIIAWGESLTANSWTHFEKDFTATTDVLYFQSSWSAGEMKFTNFVLEEAGATPEPEDMIDITIKYEDVEGNKIKDDVVVQVSKGTNEYVIPDSYKTVEDKVQGSVIYKYVYNAKETDGGDVVNVSILQDNVAKLVFDVLKADKNANLVVDGDFEDENGNFSWGTWQSPETGNYFKDVCEGWFYKVNRDTNGAALYKESDIAAEDYALGTRWNDGELGLCSLANFIEVEGGKTYIVSYDYKHKTAGSSAMYISTSFQKSKSFDLGSTNMNIPKSVTTEWQTNTFTITAPSDGYIYFHFSWVGSGNAPNAGNDGNGPFWYFDNFEVLEVITFENNITYSAGYAEILAEDGTEGYLIQASYDDEGALTGVVISEKLTLSKEEATKVQVQAGTKLMLVKDLVSLEPLAPAIIAE